MRSVKERVEEHRRVLRAGEKAHAGPPVLVQAAGGDEVLLPHDDATWAAWRTLRIEAKELARHERERVERMMALQELVGDASLVLPLRKGDQNPASQLCVGRARRNDVVICDPTVSSLHAQLELGEDLALLRDQGSSNGTFVNRRRLREGETAPLASGDCVRFGRQVFYYLTGERLLLFLELRIVWQGRRAAGDANR